MFLCSAFFDREKTTFEKIRDHFSPLFLTHDGRWRLSYLIQFFHEILQREMKKKFQIVIAIDEISKLFVDDVSKASPVEAIYEVLDRCNHLMEGQNYLWVLTTALENSGLVAIQRGKPYPTRPFGIGRPIDFIPLTRPTMAERKEIFSDYLHIKDLELLLLYSGGHWRTLEVILQELRKGALSLSQLSVLVREATRLKSADPLSDEIWTQLVRLSLASKEVPDTFELQSNPLPLVTLQHAISRAPLLNTVANIFPKFVPRLSIFQLMTWVDLQQVDEPLRIAVRNVLDEYQHLKQTLPKGHSFERFHGHWEVLQNHLDATSPPSVVRVVYESMNQVFEKKFQRMNMSPQQLLQFNMTISRLNNFLAKQLSPIPKQLFDFNEDSRITRDQLTAFQRVYSTNSKLTPDEIGFTQNIINKIIDDDVETKKIPKEDEAARMNLWKESIRFKHVFVLPFDYPALDLISFFKSSDGQVFVLLEHLKTRYSEKANISFDDISTRQKALFAFELLFPNQGVPEENVFFAVTAWKDVPPKEATKLVAPNFDTLKSDSKEFDFPNGRNVDIVAGMKELRKSYGPTLESVGWLLGMEPTDPFRLNSAGSFVTVANENPESDSKTNTNIET